MHKASDKVWLSGWYYPVYYRCISPGFGFSGTVVFNYVGISGINSSVYYNLHAN